MDGRRLTNLHAYVDDCLEPGERQAFEAQMARNPVLSQCAARWRAQNSAIHAAFDGEGTRAYAIDFGRRARDHVDKGGRSASRNLRLSVEPAASRSSVSGAVAPRISDPKIAFMRARLLGIAALTICLICASAPGPPAPSNELVDAGLAAFDAFALPGSPAVEFAIHDPEIAQKWLTARLGRQVYLPATPANVKLVGARIAPASRSAAAFLVYETDRNRLGLLLRSLDAPSPAPPRIHQAGGRSIAVWTSAGEAHVLAGDLDAPSLRRVATAFFNGRYEPDPSTPERGL